ncbi:MAG: tRNA lysidine(34) synthetase TilS, partial [Pirellulales bacterium]|nr:tRNA lysidine(34) synthetase TilS [Pirellulales bacterium]
FAKRFAKSWPSGHTGNRPIVLAVSGGAASVAMLCAAARLSGGQTDSLLVGHVHHGLRGESADRDAQFVQDLSAGLDVDCEVGYVESVSRGDGIESAAREARYAWLAQFAKSHSAAYVATAHTVDDQVETILHRILRGTGIAGLAGIPAQRELAAGVTLIRPLISFPRSEVEAYLEEIGQTYCEDETNRDTDLTRNRIRRELLPLLEQQYNVQVRDAIMRLGSLAGEAQAFIDHAAAELRIAGCIRCADNRVIIKPAVLEDASPFLIREMAIQVWKQQDWPLQSMGHEQWQRLVEMIQDVSARAQTFPGQVRAEKQGGQLVLTRPVSI